ncbi:MAG: hypothetical protein WA751_06000 [Candidatus Dormiibacterota bacterium]
MTSRKFDDEVVDSARRRLTFAFPRVGPRTAPLLAHPPLHRDFRFISAAMAGDRFAPQLSICFCWTTTPSRVDTAEVDFHRFKKQTEPLDTELCVSFIVQQLEEDLTGGHTPDPSDASFIEAGIHYLIGT